MQIAKKRAQVHFDTVFTMLNGGAFAAYAGLGRARTQSICPGARGGLSTTTHEAEEMEPVIASAPGLDEIRILTAPADSLTAEREQWNNDSNLLTLGPGVAIAYEHNTASNDYFAPQDFKVFTIPGNKLDRGRGGTHRVTYPIIRDAVSAPRP